MGNLVDIDLVNERQIETGVNHLLALRNSGQTQKALEHAITLAIHFPNNALINNINGILHASLGDFNSAILYYRKCLNLDPTNLDYLYQLALIQNTLCDFQNSYIVFQKIIALAPNRAKSYFDLALSLTPRSKNAEAALCFRRSIILKPDSVEVTEALGDLLRTMMRDHDAKSTYKKTTLLNPTFPKFYTQTIFNLFLRGKFNEALLYYGRAKIIEADIEFLHFNLGVSFNNKNEPEAAQINFKRSIIWKPQIPDAYINSSQIEIEKSQYKEANFRLKAAEIIDPISPVIHGNKAVMFISDDFFEGAIFSLKKAITLDPSFENAYINLANLFKKLEKLNVAICFYARTLVINPRSETSKHLLNSIRGKTTTKAPATYIQDLFNRYAKIFDNDLVTNLNYQAPILLREFYEENFKNNKIKLNTLDLGCGTGLGGEAFKDLCCKLTGIDLSEQMLVVAKQKKIYDELICGEIRERLQYLKEQNLEFDLFICTDVLIYIGDCDEIFSLIKCISSKRARFLLSTESIKGDGYKLLKSGRYAHSREYITQCADRYSFNVVDYREIALRAGSNITVHGDIFILEQSSA